MREVELKAVVADVEAARGRLLAAGGKIVYSGSLEDRRYDSAGGELSARDEVIRLRTYRSEGGERSVLDWKGPADTGSGYKVREELSATIEEAETIAVILKKLGLLVTREIDRRVEQFELDGATVRFETYPRMDVLVEVEGEPAAIERAIEALEMARGEFTSEALPAFVARFERRTGVRAAISNRELTGEYGESR